MSIFENLIEELKKENLIEEGVELGSEKSSDLEKSEESETFLNQSPASEEFNDIPAQKENHEPSVPLQLDLESFGSDHEIVDPADAITENDFYRRSAMDEVSSLQMVEHIFSSVEREQMNKIPKPYDSIPVSTALHEFLQVSKNHNSPENAAAEFKLMQETETWFTALSDRDKNILSAQLRRYCETANPALSPQALASLARFYRNSPYSEFVRSKFDMVITRLFSTEENNQREMAFNRQEIAQHLSELYADWSSVSLYDTEDHTEVPAIINTFEDFIEEAELESFEELVQSDFFNRLRAYKEQTGVNFYAPSVAATVIDCNVRVGNVYIRLLDKERSQSSSDSLENKYGHLLDQTISEAASKTLQLTTLLEEKNLHQQDKYEEPEKEIFEEENSSKVESSNSAEERKPLLTTAFQVNKWILGATILTVLVTIGIYLWAGANEPQISSEGVQNLQLDKFYFKDYLKSAKIVQDNLICIVNPSWDTVSKEKKKEVLTNMLVVGKEKGFRNVRLQNNEGKTIDSISEDSIAEANSK